MSRLLVLAAVAAGVTGCRRGPLRPLVRASDGADVKVADELHVETPREELLEFVPGSARCLQGNCALQVLLRMDGPIDFSLVDTSALSVGYVDGVDPLSIDIRTWEHRSLRVAIAVTDSETGKFGAPAEVHSTHQDNQTIGLEISFGAPSPDKTVLCRVVVFARPLIVSSRELVLFDSYNLCQGKDYLRMDGNKGSASVDMNFAYLTWTVNGWTQGTGHYSALRFLLNGNSPSDPGLDLNRFTVLAMQVSCTPNMVVEVFLGWGGFDSEQTHLGDLVCDDTARPTLKYLHFDQAWRDRVQTIWFHVPDWKNAAVANIDTLHMVFDIIFLA